MDPDCNLTDNGRIRITENICKHETLVLVRQAGPSCIPDKGKSTLIFFFFLNFVCVGRVPDPTSHFLPTSFLYVNLVAMGPVHLSPVTWPQAIWYWYSLTPLMHIVAQLRPIDLHNFLGQIPQSSQFFGCQ